MEKSNKTIHTWCEILSSNEFTFLNSEHDKKNKNHFSCTWKKNSPTKDGVTSITMSFLFDFSSFETIWHRLYPDVKITEADVHTTIGLFFLQIGEKAITFGSEYHEELAHMIWQKRGRIAGHHFNF